MRKFFFSLARGEAKTEAFLSRFFLKKWHYLVTLPLLLLGLYILYFIFCFSTSTYAEHTGFRDGIAQGVFVGCYIAALLFGIFLLVFKGVFHTLHSRDFARFAIFAGALSLLLYGFSLSFNSGDFSHDYGVYGGGGHWSIIHQIYTTMSFPDVNLYNQTYQPRLWHLTMALFMKFNGIFVHVSNVVVPASGSYQVTMNEYILLDMDRILMAYIGILTIYFIYRIYSYFGLQGFVLAASTVLTSFTPTLWYVWFYRNNDGLAFFFEILALYFTLRYLKKQDWASVLLTAVFIGLGMETKLNAGLISLYVAGVFIYILVKVILAKKKGQPAFGNLTLKTFLLQMVCFAAIVFPLGLGWSIYAKIKFNEPFGYVMDLGHDMNQGMYIDPSFYNPFLRYFAFPSPDLFFSIYNHRWMSQVNGAYVDKWGDLDFNCWTAFYKTAWFGEYDLTDTISPIGSVFAHLFYYAFIWITMGTMLYSICRFVLLFKEDCAGFKGNHFLRYSVVALLVIAGGSYAYFCYAYPVGCTQNARYAMLLFLPLDILMAKAAYDSFHFFSHKLQKSEAKALH
ncbi:MAG: hypothetical protein BWY98_01076 [Tenericutes bacterium ADurb.BinA155]|nr:MAG: hypothetical protein BWY98_01076 [Tenericutes bacterium ADurb.BinA155]